jgi:hypothetical protein
MKHLLLISLVLTFLSAGATACENIDKAAALCGKEIFAVERAGLEASAERCQFWSCMKRVGCSSDAVNEILASCSGQEKLAEALMSSNEAGVAATPVASPCSKKIKGNKREVQLWLLQAAMDVYFNRRHETYSEEPVPRWVGIADRVCPPAVPKTSDCSSTVTWVYWTAFGNGTDFLNNWDWVNGWTGSLKLYGRQVNATVADLEIGDLCFYYHPMHHVAIYVGGGRVVSHGMDPVGHYPWDYAPVDYCRRYLDLP